MLSLGRAAAAGHEKGPGRLWRGLLHARCRTLAHAPPGPADAAGNSGNDDARQRLHGGIRTSPWGDVKRGGTCVGRLHALRPTAGGPPLWLSGLPAPKSR